jgi:hypothetical protein
MHPREHEPSNATLGFFALAILSLVFGKIPGAGPSALERAIASPSSYGS